MLLYQPVYFPYQPAPAAVKRRLTGLVRSANSQGYQVRVAVVQSPRDLGSVSELFAKPPAVYARFLSAELTSAWRHRVLVVIPGGLRASRGGRASCSVKGVLQIRETTTSGPDEAVLRRLPPPSGNSPTALIDAAGRALRALAARHDVSLVATIPQHAHLGGRRRLALLRAARGRGLGHRRPDGRPALVPLAHPPGPLTKPTAAGRPGLIATVTAAPITWAERPAQ